jgi:hypothetical protein
MPSSMHDIDISLSLSLISCSNNELHHTLATPAPLQPPTRHPTGPNHPLSLSRTFKTRHMSKPPRHWPPLCILEPYQARHRLCPVSLALSRRCSVRQQTIEHLAGINWASSPRADRAPPNLYPRQRPRPTPLNPLAQQHLASLSISSWPCSPHAAARQRVPRPVRTPAASKL